MKKSKDFNPDMFNFPDDYFPEFEFPEFEIPDIKFVEEEPPTSAV